MADINQFQPLFPEDRVLGPLHELAAELVRECHTLQGQASGPMARALGPRLRAMNSYYTNKIEGHGGGAAAGNDRSTIQVLAVA